MCGWAENKGESSHTFITPKHSHEGEQVNYTPLCPMTDDTAGKEEGKGGRDGGK